MLRTIVQQNLQTRIYGLLHFYCVLKPTIPTGMRFALRHYHAIPPKWASATTGAIKRAFVGKPADGPGWSDCTQPYHCCFRNARPNSQFGNQKFLGAIETRQSIMA